MLRTTIIALLLIVGLSASLYAGELALVIDDVGYRLKQDKQILQLPSPITVAILPGAPHALEMANLAYRSQHDVMIHMPMQPFSKQPLEKNTLTPEMDLQTITFHIDQAINSVPHAIGMNNHMGSRMTSSLVGMQRVMHALQQRHLFFLDSMTIASSQVLKAAQGYGVKIYKRQIFLDDNNDPVLIRVQLLKAIKLAQKKATAIAIGHPRPATIAVLQQMIPNLPADVRLVRVNQLSPVNQPESKNNVTINPSSAQTHSLIAQCRRTGSLPIVYPAQAVRLIYSSISQSHFVNVINRLLPILL